MSGDLGGGVLGRFNRGHGRVVEKFADDIVAQRDGAGADIAPEEDSVVDECGDVVAAVESGVGGPGTTGVGGGLEEGGFGLWNAEDDATAIGTAGDGAPERTERLGGGDGFDVRDAAVVPEHSVESCEPARFRREPVLRGNDHADVPKLGITSESNGR